ncbi:MAG TPA: prenyltransferase/squalene oxidase repeat-containing protein, partial [Solirubrobacterales bacterium]|nr:prenyltransferase/squalene oxidase repeat-containing protein [Solirubrobacterales bacterium]
GLDKTISWLASVQNEDGGWGDVPGQPSNADVTGSVMQAIPDSKAAERGLSYLRKHQRSSGGFGLGSGGAVNSQSTAWAVQGTIAVGGDPAKAGPGGSSALDYLAARQTDDGHYRYSESSDQTPVWVTSQVLVAAAGEALPVAAPPRQKTPKSPEPAVSPPSVVAPPPSSEAAPGVEGPAPSSPPAAGTGVPGGTAAPPPVADGVTPVPGVGSPGVESEAPPTETGTPAAASIEGTEPASPWIAIGVGLGATAAAIAAPLLLGRRFGW